MYNFLLPKNRQKKTFKVILGTDNKKIDDTILSLALQDLEEKNRTVSVYCTADTKPLTVKQDLLVDYKDGVAIYMGHSLNQWGYVFDYRTLFNIPSNYEINVEFLSDGSLFITEYIEKFRQETGHDSLLIVEYLTEKELQ